MRVVIVLKYSCPKIRPFRENMCTELILGSTNWRAENSGGKYCDYLRQTAIAKLSQMDIAAAQGGKDGLRSIRNAKMGKNGADVTFHGSFGNS